MRKRLSRVLNNRLINVDRTEIIVGSAEWYTWLEQTISFTVEYGNATFTVRKERFQRGGWYWKAYYRHNGKLRSTYLGASERLTQERLQSLVNLVQPTRDNEAASDLAFIDSVQSSYPVIVDMKQQAPAALHEEIILLPKLHIPRMRDNLVERTQILERMQGTQTPDVLLVSAPAGYGKTTLLSTWATRLLTPLAWVSLDSEDNNATRFWLYVITSLQTACPTLGTRALRTLQPEQGVSTNAFLALLINDIAGAPQTLTLILDDYHLIADAAIHEGVAFLLHHLPATLQVVLSSRVDPPFSLNLLYGQGKALILRTEDLRFMREEIRQFFVQSGATPITLEEITALETYTEGWVTGLQIATLLLQRTSTIQQLLATLRKGNPQAITDYLLEEVLAKQPTDVQQFLLETALLNRVCGGLCDAVRDQQDSRRYLTYIEKSNLFLLGIDEEGEWYRYHHLFAEALHIKMRQTDPQRFQLLHARAAHWYAQQQLMPEAIAYAFLAQDFELAARYLTQVAESMLQHGFVTQVKSWLDALPEQTIRANPRLCQTRAEILGITGQFDLASQWTKYASEALAQPSMALTEVERNRFIGDIMASQAVVIGIQGDRQQAFALLKDALQYFATGDTLLRAHAMMNMGVNAAEMNNFAEAITLFSEARVLAESGYHMNTVAMIGSRQGNLALKLGKLHQAATTLRYTIRRVKEADSSETLAYELYSNLGRVHYEWNEFDEATEFLEESLRIHARYGGSQTVLARTLETVTLINFHTHRTTQMQTMLDQLEQQAYDQNAHKRAVATNAAMYWIHVQFLQNNRAEAIKMARALGLDNESPPGFSFAAHNTLTARIWLAQGNHVEALVLLEKIRLEAENGERWGQVITILNVEAVLYYERGEVETALTRLMRSLRLAAPENWIRVYLDMGTPMIALLSKLSRHLPVKKFAHPERQLSDYIQRLLRSAEQQKPGKFVTLPENAIQIALSEREVEIIGLITQGRSNREIAQSLVIELTTVKWHVQNIFAKFHVHNRTQLAHKLHNHIDLVSRKQGRDG